MLWIYLRYALKQAWLFLSNTFYLVIYEASIQIDLFVACSFAKLVDSHLVCYLLPYLMKIPD
jgi:hypothetical protein